MSTKQSSKISKLEYTGMNIADKGIPPQGV